ncbi:MAG: hypothetical protein QOE70_5616 [Chthoniobacter sp.]|jgi:CheY-like chemotaxis protein|nr:hypothetical protein [Chthoniobacter sp.]
MRVLIADDDREFGAVLASYVRELQHEVVGTITGGGLAVIKSFPLCRPDVVLLDIAMPRFNGFTVCHALLSRDPGAKIIFISGSEPRDHPWVTGAGAFGYLEKPILREQLREMLEAAAA